MKKILCVVLAAILVIAAAVPVAAGQHHKKTKTQVYAVCEKQGCVVHGMHEHNGVAYTGHYYGDGHDYHGYCVVTDCEQYGYHEHDGEHCFRYCDVTGCLKNCPAACLEKCFLNCHANCAADCDQSSCPRKYTFTGSSATVSTQAWGQRQSGKHNGGRHR